MGTVAAAGRRQQVEKKVTKEVEGVVSRKATTMVLVEVLAPIWEFQILTWEEQLAVWMEGKERGAPVRGRLITLL